MHYFKLFPQPKELNLPEHGPTAQAPAGGVSWLRPLVVPTSQQFANLSLDIALPGRSYPLHDERVLKSRGFVVIFHTSDRILLV